MGDRVTAWIAAHRNVRIVETIVELSSDLEFHCLSIVMLCIEHSNAAARLAAAGGRRPAFRRDVR